MKITLDGRKSIHANAAEQFEKSKRLREKISRMHAAIMEVETRLAALDKKHAEQEKAAKEKIIEKKSAKREWFEAFHFFRTSGGLLCIAGRDARQNELLVAKHFVEGDLFFHADVQGAAATILKGGAVQGVSPQDLLEAAQFAASFSKAWKGGFTSVDVYAVGRGQVSKSAQSGEYLAKGAFVIRGERKWFRNTELKLAVGKNEQGKLVVLPAVAAEGKAHFSVISPGEQKGVLANSVSAKLGLSRAEREVLAQLVP